jgi:hypothetical protein
MAVANPPNNPLSHGSPPQTNTHSALPPTQAAAAAIMFIPVCQALPPNKKALQPPPTPPAHTPPAGMLPHTHLYNSSKLSPLAFWLWISLIADSRILQVLSAVAKEVGMTHDRSFSQYSSQCSKRQVSQRDNMRQEGRQPNHIMHQSLWPALLSACTGGLHLSVSHCTIKSPLQADVKMHNPSTLLSFQHHMPMLQSRHLGDTMYTPTH